MSTRDAQNQKWVSLAALSSAILAVLAGLSGVYSSSHGNAITRELIRSSNTWTYYQAKGIKANLLQTKVELLSSEKHPPSNQDLEKLKEYKVEQEKLAEKAKDEEERIEYHVKLAGMYSRSVTLFQIAIGLVAVSILTRRNSFWLVGLGLAVIGVYFSIHALILT